MENNTNKDCDHKLVMLPAGATAPLYSFFLSKQSHLSNCFCSLMKDREWAVLSWLSSPAPFSCSRINRYVSDGKYFTGFVLSSSACNISGGGGGGRSSSSPLQIGCKGHAHAHCQVKHTHTQTKYNKHAKNISLPQNLD